MNNFDTSSQGVNLELSISWDTDLSQRDFNDNFSNISRSGGSLLNSHYFNVDTWLFTGGIIGNDFDLADTDNYNLKSATIKQIKQWYNDNISNYTMDQNDASIRYFDTYFSRLTKSQLIELIENETCTQDFIEFLTDTFNPLFEVLPIRGHCQGDYAEIIFTNGLMKDYSFKDKDQFLNMMQNHFINLFYDAPLYARLTIDNNEFYLDDFQKDRYSYDKKETIEHVKSTLKHDKLDYIISWLDNNLPDQPEYR